MTPPYQRSGADVVFWTLLVLFVLGEYVMRFRTRRSRRGSPVERRSLVVVAGCSAVAIVAAFQLANSSRGSIGDAAWPLFVLGLALMAAGLAVRQWAILTLGSLFTIDVRVRPNQPVVEQGPYRWVRHPSYSGLVLFFVGLGLALSNWASLAVLAVLPLAGLLVRIRAEERALLASLGDDYRRFAATRRRLFPGVW